MLGTVRTFIAVAAVTLIAASLVHFGILLQGDRHQEAGTAEAVIAGVMLIGLALTWLRAPWGRRAGLAALAFGLLGVSVGLFTVIIGVGPDTLPDIVYHVLLFLFLIVGLVTARRKCP